MIDATIIGMMSAVALLAFTLGWRSAHQFERYQESRRRNRQQELAMAMMRSGYERPETVDYVTIVRELC